MADMYTTVTYHFDVLAVVTIMCIPTVLKMFLQQVDSKKIKVHDVSNSLTKADWQNSQCQTAVHISFAYAEFHEWVGAVGISHQINVKKKTSTEESNVGGFAWLKNYIRL